jgi:flagellar biosynthesis protein FliR
MVPLLFTGILYSALGIVSPILDQRIDWFWFVPSQIVFGLVCGFVVNLEAKIRTPQFQALPFAVRAGLHGDMDSVSTEKEDDTDVPKSADRKDLQE